MKWTYMSTEIPWSGGQPYLAFDYYPGGLFDYLQVDHFFGFNGQVNDLRLEINSIDLKLHYQVSGARLFFDNYLLYVELYDFSEDIE